MFELKSCLIIILNGIIIIKTSKEIEMKLSLIPLKDWISSNCGNVPSVEQKEEAAFILNVGVATIYRWLKSGDVYIEDLGIDDCGGSLVIWKKEKLVEA